jgi:hypothetical protein
MAVKRAVAIVVRPQALECPTDLFLSARLRDDVIRTGRGMQPTVARRRPCREVGAEPADMGSLKSRSLGLSRIESGLTEYRSYSSQIKDVSQRPCDLRRGR